MKKSNKYGLSYKKNYSYFIRIEKENKIKSLFNILPINKLKIEESINYLNINKDDNVSFDVLEKILVKLNYQILEEIIDINFIFIIIKKLINKIFYVKPSIITIIGHVDNGKTSILDYINNTNIINEEVGGITQYSRIFRKKFDNKTFIFIDTPGHESFLNIINLCLKITNILILVVAIDDLYNNEVIKFIEIIKSFNLSVIIVISKIDKINYNLKNIESNFCKYNIISEKLGGNYKFIYTSIKSKEGLNELIDCIKIKSELLNLKYLYNGITSGFIVESYIDKNRGPVASIIIEEGILIKGDFILSNYFFGNVKYMLDEFNNKVDMADPSIPVKLFGFLEIPESGNKFFVIDNKKFAKKIAINRKKLIINTNLVDTNNFKKIDLLSNKDFFIKNKLNLNFILNTDVINIKESIINSINKISIENNITINIIRSNVGTITENDIYIALSSNSILLGFNININSYIFNLINKFKLKFKLYYIIYDLIDDVKKIINDIKELKKQNNIVGSAEVINIFDSSKLNIIGCKIIYGFISKFNYIKISRNKLIIYNGNISSMKFFKKDINEANNKMEFGMNIPSKNKIKVGDIIISYVELEN